ncbi:MAG TPA: tryptophan synthase subunit alpha [Coriobacteriia bacterium]
MADDRSGSGAPAGGGARSAGLGRGFASGRTSLVAYLMAGYPDRDTSFASLRAVARAGADLIELGVPYGDPLADGPVIAEAAKAAMAAAGGRFGLAETIALAGEFLAEAYRGDGPGTCFPPPVALMTYLNPMLRMGLPEVARRAAEAGLSGFIVPDMLPGTPMARRWLSSSEPAGLDTPFLVAPTSTNDRLTLAAEAATGFVYCVSSVGVTGERDRLPEGLADLVARVREASGGIPVAVGFGIGTPEQAASVGRIADGVVIGSAIVRRQADPDATGEFVRALRGALDAVEERPAS